MQLNVKQLAASGAASGEVLSFNGTNWAPATAPNGAIGGSITGATAGSVLFAGVAGVLAQDNANFFWNNTDNHLYIGSTTPALPSVLSITGGTLTGTARALYADGTLSTTANQFLATLDITTGGSTGAIFKGGLSCNILAGYTGAGGSVAGSFTNAVAGTDTWDAVSDPIYATQLGNAAIVGIAKGTTAGTNLGAHLSALGSSASNTALVVVADSSTNSPTDNYGVIALAASGSARNIAGAFSLGSLTSLTSSGAAIIADVGSVASPIFIGREAGSNVAIIGEHGTVALTPTASHGEHVLELVGGTLADGKRLLTGTATLSSTGTPQAGLNFSITSAGSVASASLTALTVLLNAGYTGTGSTYGSYIYNNVNGTGNAPLASLVGQFGALVQSEGSTSGARVGLMATTQSSSSRGYGLIGQAASSGETIGVYGHASAGSTVTGGMFTLYGNTDSIGTLTSAALIVDNAAVAAPIFIGRDNGTTVYSIIDGGSVEMAEISAPATPAANFGRLYVKAKAATNSIYYKDDAGTEFDLTAGSFAIGGTVTSGTTGSILFVGAASALAQDNANFFWDDTNNRLGIGTASPSYPIHVSHTAAASRYVSVTAVNATGDSGFYLDNTADGSYIQTTLYGSSTSGANIFGVSAAGVAEILLRPQSNTRGIIAVTGTGSPLIFGVAGSERMRIATDGNVDIGGTGAANKLVVSADGTAGTPAIALGATADSNTGIFHPAADTLAFSTGGTERVRIDSSGNVGIGVTALSGYALHVSGNNALLTNAGTNTTTLFQVYDSNSLTNAGYVLFGIDTSGATTGYSGQGAFVSAGKGGTGTIRDLILHNFNNAGIVLAPNNTEYGRMTGGGVWQLAAATGYTTLATSPSQLTANQNDYNPGTGVYFRLSSDASRDITGIANGTDGRRITIVNVGSNNIVLKNDDANSTAANRLLTGTGADVTLGADDSAELVYDATTSRWRFTSIKV